MPEAPLTEMTERARAIFQLVVEGYLSDGQSVGSKMLASDERINLSPASIRSVLADLERLGLLAAPHTSAARLPTESGLRLFVDGMMQMSEPSAAERAAIEDRMGEFGPIEEALEATSALLSDISGAAGMVTVPRRQTRLRQLNLVPLSDTQVLAVLVGTDGQVENRIVPLAYPADRSALEQAANFITEKMSGKTLSEAAQALDGDIAAERHALSAASRDLVERGIAVWTQDPADRPILIVRGQANLLDDGALKDLERVRSLLDDLENKRSVAELLEGARDAEATRIFIGSENRLFSLSGSSVIASPYRDDSGKVVGVLGVIGPTRLNYARLVPMVDFTAKSLGRSLGKLIG
ncbi:MAG: heat-inducible transcriptional repressor HrcA [Pontixanthobacter sp.]